jgi:hypothetical protein
MTAFRISVFILGMAVAQSVPAAGTSQFTVEQSWDIAQVPSGFPVRFCLLTDNERQYVAYYDEQRRMTVASRAFEAADEWQRQILPSNVGWDSHNYITMAVDRDGHLHVSGNMHADPLVYFRTETPGDITTLKPFSMTGKLEKRTTYPRFMTNHEGQLIFNYRHGGSGRGIQIFNIYDLKAKTWAPMLDTPLFDGEKERSCYHQPPVLGPDGWFHTVWVWRDTPDCATNHHLSYARSKDLIHWESAFGEKVELPIRLGQQTLWVDPIPSGGGIINGGHKLIFGADMRPVITYHKSDAAGNMQVYAARPEKGNWIRHVLTDWEHPINFGGNGSVGFIGIRISKPSKVAPKLLTMTYQHREYGNGRLFIDEETLQPQQVELDIVPEYPAELNLVQSDYSGMRINRFEGIDPSKDKAARFLLQWETLKRNHDQPRDPPLPPPGILRLYKLKAAE